MAGTKRRSGRYPYGPQKSFREKVEDYLTEVFINLDEIGNEALNLRDEEVWELTVKLKEDIYWSDCIAVITHDDKEVE